MARSQRRKRSQPRRGGPRSALRKLNRAINEHLTVSRIPGDPPSIAHSRVIHTTTQLMIVAGDADKFEARDPPLDHIMTVTWKRATKAVNVISYTEMVEACLKTYGVRDTVEGGKRFQCALIKAALWGPLPQVIAASVSLHVNVDDNHRASVDHGSPMSRPRTSISVAKLHWGAAKKMEITVEITSQTTGEVKPGTILGVLQLTVASRLYANVPLA